MRETAWGRFLFVAMQHSFAYLQPMKFLHDNNTGVDLTPRQWAKRAVGRIARRHCVELQAEIEQLSEEDRQLVADEFSRMVKLLETRRGFILA
jgi:hypothetical protein